ncbi:Multiple RNA-binding domain-containing protein 1 [Teratosphaeriaceae sp. CCFEE 6253]|nr:Multiple RNA-binding domain-containing protein 1 [Teratosphaeriaceae sp. CCFEE 6253]
MAETLSSSRIFIKGLPPTFTDPEFRKHFARGGSDGEITDAKIFANRRIGYVGYRTPEEAQKAVKYFNRTFIRMSRINVEIARPIEAPGPSPRTHPTARLDPRATGDDESASGTKRKRASETKEEEDPKLKEFLESYKPRSKKKAWESDATQVSIERVEAPDQEWHGIAEGQSDNEYEVVPKKTKRAKPQPGADPLQAPAVPEPELNTDAAANEASAADASAMVIDGGVGTAKSDADWARSRTSRLLGLIDEDEEETLAASHPDHGFDGEDDDVKVSRKDTGRTSTIEQAASSLPSPPLEVQGGQEEARDPSETVDADAAAPESTNRLFVRNLPYDVLKEDLEAEFEQFGDLEEVHVSMDKKTGRGKGFAFLQYSDDESAERALAEKDGRTFQGRLIHILRASAKREKLDDFALSKLPLKVQQQIKRKREAAAKTYNWNALYMNVDAVLSSVADRLGLAKSAVLDPTSSDAAVKQAHAETHIIQETKAYFRQQGVDLDSFKKSQRGDTAILVKNISYDCSKDELKRLFEEHGDVKRFLTPPSGVIAIIEMANAAQCKAAYDALAYRTVKSSRLFLEKAPRDVFSAKPVPAETTAIDGVTKTSASELKATDADSTVPDVAGAATLFVRNLNFTTTTKHLTETFNPLSGFMSAVVKTKTDPKKPGQVLSMGFGFLEFASASQAQAALRAMEGYMLEGHKLQIRASNRGGDAAETRRTADTAKRAAGKKTKVIIKNLPFEATKKDVRALCSAYGQLRSVRMPKKIDNGVRGFAFVDFTTPKEAENAMDALRSTHLLGRRLVLDFAEGDPEDAEAEIEKMQKKVGGQVNKVALQKLTSGGRKKFTTEVEEE